MNKAVTNNIVVKSRPFFQAIHSAPHLNKFVYSYRISITNQSNEPVQLLSRRWDISNAFGKTRSIEGKGVIGKQPVILPGDTFEYNSWSPMNTEQGIMRGSYSMMRLTDNSKFDIKIPDMNLIVPYKLN